MIQPNFKWWMGVVEDRADPERIGRYRVRILGYHTANKIELPTKDLPWASTVLPVTSASISGVSQTPNLVEGSTVVGFFGDGDEEQLPVIMGSLPGIPQERIENPSVGFSDPYKNYPRNGEDVGYNGLKEPDISRLARGINAEDHASLTQKRNDRIKDIPTAKASSVAATGEDIPGVDYENQFWDEPHPRFGSTDKGSYTPPGEVPTFDDGKTSVYPYNNVTETESGHVFEVDDTPGNGRIHEYHNSGTYYEIQADGSKITKVVGDDFEISIQNKKVFIGGSCDVTISGDAKLIVDGDMIQEIGGNLITTVYKNRITKIGGNDITEVLSGSNTNVAKDMGVRVGQLHSFSCGSDSTNEIGGSMTINTGLDYSLTSSIGRMDFLSGLGVSISTAAGNITQTAAFGTFRASGLGMSLLSQTTQNIVAGTGQLIETAGTQTMNSLVQSTIAPTRLIAGATVHTGLYTITGAATVTGLVTSGSVYSLGTIISGTVSLSTHTHGGVVSGPAFTLPPLV
tara:strand:+ start:489 stop:2027 length:1539 start_codon:yes stop_codon:yes gene_type:complete